MAIDPSIPLGGVQPKFQSPFESMGRLMQFRGMQQQQALGQQQLALGHQEIDKYRRAVADQNAQDEAVQPGFSLEQILKGLPGHLHARATKDYQDNEEAKQKARTAKSAADEAQADWFGHFGSVLQSYDNDPGVAAMLIQKAEADGEDVSQIKALLARDPSKLPQLSASLIAASPKYRALRNTETGQADTAANNAADNTRDDKTLTATIEHQRATELQAQRNAVEAARANRVSEGQRAQGLNLERGRSWVLRDGRPVRVSEAQILPGDEPYTNARENQRKVTSGDAGTIAEYDGALDDIAVLRSTLTETKGATGTAAKVGAILPNAVTELTGWGETSKKRQATIDRVKQVIGKALEGGVLRKEDELKYAKILPTIADTQEVAMAKIAGLERAITLRKSRQLDALSDAGYDVSNFTARSAAQPKPAAPKVNPFRK